MNTIELLHQLNKAYPRRGFYAKPYIVDDQSGTAIMFLHGGDEIYNPFLDMNGEMTEGCYVEEYGILDIQHANLMRRHNLHYEAWVIKKFLNLEAIYDSVVEWAARPDGKQLDPSEWLRDLGFTPYHTGGGCMAYFLEDPETRRYLLVTDDDAQMPTRFDEMHVGLYADDATLIKDSLLQHEPVEPKPWHLNQAEVDDLAEAALNAACLVIQEKLGVTDGGYASIYFSDDEVREEFKDYIQSEINNLDQGA